ncbi:hypothetical protein [Lentzea sp. CA-135723]|uniref:hypothetical protein n=1 Tax=Lentzea sp. CA-135723 TaxID=3239950 RepID=UPI003D8E455E
MADDKPPAGYRHGDEGALIALEDGNYGTKADYDTWDWKAIKSAIANIAAATAGSEVAEGERVSNPESLWDAAETFRKIKEVLIVVGDSITEQAEAVAGEDGPWQGLAATTVLGTMKQFAKTFHNHATQIDGGPARLNPTPEGLYTAGNYLQWAINEVSRIDYHYANEVIRIANEYNERAEQYNRVYTGPNSMIVPYIEAVMPNGMVEVSKFPKVVEAMTDDMRKVLKELATQYDATRFDASLATVTPLPPPGRTDTDEDGPEDKNDKYDPTKYEHKPPPDKEDRPEDDPEKYKPETYKPPPRPEVDGPPGDDETSRYKPPPKPEFEGPRTDTPTTFTPPPKPPDAEAFRPDLEGPGSVKPPGGPETDGPGQFKPPSFDPLSPDLTGGPGGPKPGDPITGPPILSNPIAPPVKKPGSLNAVTPPPKLGGPNGLTPPGVKDPVKPFDPKTPPNLGGAAPKPPGLDPVGKPDVKVPDPRDWQAGGPDQLAPPDRRDLTGGSPMMPPFSPPAHNGQGGPERPDSSGLLDGGPKPWEGTKPPGLGDPDGFSESPGDRESWAPVGGVPQGLGGSPMMPPMAPPAQNNQGGAERPDAAGLLDGGAQPWEGVDAPGLGDPDGFSEMPGDRESWAPVGGVPQGFGGSPMMPPMAPPAQNNQGGAERPDAAGLLDGGAQPWEGVDAPGLGDPDGIAELPGDRESWAPVSAVPQGFGGSPMMPPMAPPAQNNQGGAERPDAAGLLDGGAQPWEGVDAPGLGDPDGIAELPGDRERWAPIGGVLTPGLGGSPTAPPQSGAERPESAGLLDGGPQPWGSVSSPGLGDPGVPVVVPPPVPMTERPARREDDDAVAAGGMAGYEPAAPGADGTVVAPAEDAVAVVRAGGDEDFSAWDVGAAGGVLWFAGAAKRAEDEREDEPAPHTPDYALRETTPWEHTSRHASAPVAAEPVRDGAGRRAYWPPLGGGCTGETRPEEEPETEEEQEEEERRAVDLLRQADEAWSSAPRLNASGVIE